MPMADEKPKRSLRPRFDPAAGDDDLYVSDLSGRMWRLVFFAAVGLALLSGLGLGNHHYARRRRKKPAHGTDRSADSPANGDTSRG